MLAVFASTALTISLRAQEEGKKERKISLWGHIKDNVTRIGIGDVFVTLMTSDSLVVDTMHVEGWNSVDGGTKFDATYRFRIPAKP